MFLVHLLLPRSLLQGEIFALKLNACCVVNKRLNLFAKLSSLNPGIVMITETYLDETINDNEIFPSIYTVNRLDRNCHEGSVLVAALDTLSSVACPRFDRDNIELIWVQLICNGKPVLLGVFYRPPNSLDSYLLEL